LPSRISAKEKLSPRKMYAQSGQVLDCILNIMDKYWEGRLEKTFPRELH
jgi:hypothetical protein